MPAYRLTTIMTGTPGSPWVSQQWIDQGVTPDANDAADAVRLFWNAVSGQIASGVTIQVQPEAPLFTTPDTPTSVESTLSAPVTTLGGANPLPPATQGLIRLRTGTFNGTRRVLGKIYVPYMSEEACVAGGQMDSTIAGILDSAATALMGSGLVVASRALNLFAPVTSTDVWNQFAVLRSRRD